MIDDAIKKITELMIKDHFENNNKKIIMNKTDLYNFCVKLLKTLKEEGNEAKGDG